MALASHEGVPLVDDIEKRECRFDFRRFNLACLLYLQKTQRQHDVYGSNHRARRDPLKHEQICHPKSILHLRLNLLTEASGRLSIRSAASKHSKSREIVSRRIPREAKSTHTEYRRTATKMLNVQFPPYILRLFHEPDEQTASRKPFSTPTPQHPNIEYDACLKQVTSPAKLHTTHNVAPASPLHEQTKKRRLFLLKMANFGRRVDEAVIDAHGRADSSRGKSGWEHR